MKYFSLKHGQGLKTSVAHSLYPDSALVHPPIPLIIHKKASINWSYS